MISIIDIGSTGGVEPPWAANRSSVDWFLNFEPNEATEIKDKWIKYDTAIWSEKGKRPFYVYGPNGTGSSLLRQNYNWVADNYMKIQHEGHVRYSSTWFERSVLTEKKIVNVNSIDNVIKQLKDENLGPKKFDLLKSDTQGAEMEVLLGATKWLEEDALALEMELYRYPLYEGLTLENDVISFMKEKGFVIAGWSGYFCSFNGLSDYLFIRKEPRTDEEREKIKLIQRTYGLSKNKMNETQSIKDLPDEMSYLRMLKGVVKDTIGRTIKILQGFLT